MKAPILPICLILSFAVSWNAFAQEETPEKAGGHVYAVIVGISDYRSINDLSFADQDAEAFNQYIGAAFPDARSVVLTNEQANHDTLLNALYDILIDAGQGDTVIFYFSGHGDCESALVNQPGFLLTHDTPPHNYLIAALRVDDLKALIESYVKAKNAEVIFFIDACRAGQLAGHNAGGPSKTASLLLDLFDKEVMFLSCTPNQKSFEYSDLEHGVFTYYLLRGLLGAADANQDNFLEVEELRRYLLDEVSERTDKKQTPISNSNPVKVMWVCPEKKEALALEVPESKKRFGRPGAVQFQERSPSGLPGFLPNADNPLKWPPDEILKKFYQCIEEGRLIAPKEDCADFYFRQYPSDPEHRKNKEKMQARLINELIKASSGILLKYIYEGHTSILPADCEKGMKELSAARSMIAPDHFLYRTVASRQLFLYALAQHYIPSPDWQSAIDSLKKSVQLEPAASYAYNELGIAASKLEGFVKAELYFDTAMALSPGWKFPEVNLQNAKMIAEERGNEDKNKDFQPIVGGRHIYVKKGGSGNGSSWAQATGNLQGALLHAKDNSQIWVASGKYFTTEDNDRTKSFVIPEGVEIYGGFAGYETSLEQRDPLKNLTILSGEIGQPSKDDNAYTVVYTKNISYSTVIDGFVIMGGSAIGSDSQNPLHYKGAGWYNDATNANSSPTIRNCIFMDNIAREGGGGLYNYTSNGTCEAYIENCKFIRNISDIDGGAIFNDGNNGKCAPQLTNCLFEANEATYGAAIFNKADYGLAVPRIRNCVFVANIAYIRGSGVYNDRTASSRGTCDAVMTGCRFEKNSSSIGNEISIRIENFDYQGPIKN